MKTKCCHQPNIGCLPCKQAAKHNSRRARSVLAPIDDRNATHKEDVASAHASTTEAASNASRHPAAPNSVSGDYRGTRFAGPEQVWKSSHDNLTCSSRRNTATNYARDNTKEARRDTTTFTTKSVSNTSKFQPPKIEYRGTIGRQVSKVLGKTGI